MKELWKPIKGFETFYEVSNLGRIKRIPKGNVLLVINSRGGYLRSVLSAATRRKTVSIHRLVAQHFIPNPENKPTVNHKDFNLQNNRDKNLEWTTHRENVQHSCKAGRHFKKPVLQIDLKNGTVKKWASAWQVELETGWFSTQISAHCWGKGKTYKGFIWRFA